MRGWGGELKLLRPQHGDREIGDEEQGDDAHEDGFHGEEGSEGFAGARIGAADDKEGDEEEEVEQVDHGLGMLIRS